MPVGQASLRNVTQVFEEAGKILKSLWRTHSYMQRRHSCQRPTSILVKSELPHAPLRLKQSLEMLSRRKTK